MSGITVWVWVSLVVGLTATLLVMTRRIRETRARLGRLEGRLTAVLEGSDIGLSVWDAAGHLVGFNRKFKEFYPDAPIKPGVVYEDLIRYTASRGVVQMPDHEVEPWVAECVRGFGAVGQQVLRTPDRRWLDLQTRPTAAGEVLLFYRDTTGLREAEATLSESRQQRHRESSELGLLADVITASHTASSLESAAERTLALICRWSGWPVGQVYRVERGGDAPEVLRSVALWLEDTPDGRQLQGFRSRAEHTRPQAGDGIAGRVLLTGRPVWVPNVSVDPAIDPAQRDAMPGVRGGCGVPVADDRGVIAVLEFFSWDQLGPDATTTRLLESAAQVLGPWLTSRTDP